MPIRKKGNIKVKTSPNGYGIERTGYTFYSYDKNSAALVFTFIDSDNAPVNLSKADVQLLLISDNGDEFPVDKDDIDVISAVRGTARYVIPENLLGYEGKITGHIYLDFEDGSHTDEGQFTFNIKRSAITDLASEFGKQYVQDFEDVKERVEQAGDSATKDIEKAKDDAESQIGDYVGEIESAKQDISSSVSDVQNKASEASEDISGLVKTTEDARDNAESQIGEYVGEVESAKDSTIEDIDKALPEVEDKLQDLQKEMIVGGRNYIKNSNLWASKEGAPMEIMRNKLTTGTYVFSVDIEIENTDKEGTQGRLGAEAKVYLEDGSHQYISCWYRPEQGESFKGRISSTIEFASKPKKIGYSYLQAGLVNGDVVRSGLPKLEWGNVASDWLPAIEDYDAKIKRLEKAIINLGGSI